MNKSVVWLATVFILVFGIASSFGQNVSEEARRHFDRGVTALKMANSIAECKPAIEELGQATKLAPDWPEAFYNLGLAQEKAERFKDAVASYKQYLRLAPNADDAEEVKSLINGLEYKAENILTATDIIDILVALQETILYQPSYGSSNDPSVEWHLSKMEWQYQGNIFFNALGMSKEMRVGDDDIKVLEVNRYRHSPSQVTYQILHITGPILKYHVWRNECDEEFEKWLACRGLDNGDLLAQHEIEVVSKKLVKITQTLTGTWVGPVCTKLNGRIFTGIFTKNDSASDRKALLGEKLSYTSGREESERLIAQGADVNAKGYLGRTPLHYADNKAKAELLIAHGADVNAKDNNGLTPLDYAKRDKKKELATLLENHINGIRKIDTAVARDPALDAKLLDAAIINNKEEAERLIARGADINAKDIIGGQTPLHKAAYWNHKEVAQLLIAKGANVNAKDNNGWTPLEATASRSQNEMAELLIANGADINAKDNRGRTPLHRAADFGKNEMAELLITKGADINAKDDNGLTPLHCAAAKDKTYSDTLLIDKIKLAELLFTKGADVNAKNNIGETPLQLAEKNGFNDMADLLKKHGAK